MRTSTMFDLASVTKVMANDVRGDDAGRSREGRRRCACLSVPARLSGASSRQHHRPASAPALVGSRAVAAALLPRREQRADLRRHPRHAAPMGRRRRSALQRSRLHAARLHRRARERAAARRVSRAESVSPARAQVDDVQSESARVHGIRGDRAGQRLRAHMVYDSTFGYRYKGDPTAERLGAITFSTARSTTGNSFYANGGSPGHADSFSTASDLRVLLDLLANRGTYGGLQYIRPTTVGTFHPRQVPELPRLAVTARIAGRSFSHTGFTGTYVLGVPKYGLSIVLTQPPEHGSKCARILSLMSVRSNRRLSGR